MISHWKYQYFFYVSLQLQFLPDNSHSRPMPYTIVIEKIYIWISICLLKGIYVTIQSSKLFDRVQQLYMN